MRHMFQPKELEADPALILELKEEVREECERLGEVTNVVLYEVCFPSVLVSARCVRYSIQKIHM